MTAARKRTSPATAKARADRAAQARQKIQKRAAKKSPPKPVRARGSFDHVTAEQLVQCRDKEQLSWRAVAVKLELGSPGQARKAYSELTGRSHSESVIASRAVRGASKTKASLRPKWTNKTKPSEIRSAINHRIILVERNLGEPEPIRVRKVLGFQMRTGSGKVCPLQVHFIDDYNGASRSVFVKKIVAVQ